MPLLNPHVEIEDLGGRRRRQTIHVAPVGYYDGGSLAYINDAWGDSGDGARPHIVTASKLMVSVGNDGMRRIPPTRELDRYTEIGAPYIKVGGDWTKVNLGQPTRSTNLLSWSTTNANVYISHGGHYIKLGILLKNGWQPVGDQFAFPVGLTGLTRTGDTFYRDGEPVLLLRKPVVYDLDDPKDTRPIAHEFVSVAGQPYILFTLPDLTGMVRPLVDPQFSSQPDAAAGKDTYIRSSAPFNARNYGTTVDLLDGSDEKALIEFDCSSIPATATIETGQAATISLYHSVQSSSVSFTLTFYSIASGNADWPEGTKANGTGVAGDCCWDYKDQAASPTAWAGSAGLSTANTDYESSSLGSVNGNRADAVGTEYSTVLTASRIEGWFGVSNTNYGLLITCGANLGAIASSDHATAGYRPKLVIDYTEAGGGTVSVSVSDALTVSEAVVLLVPVYYVSISDTLTAAESKSVNLTITVVAADAIVATDTLTLAYNLGLSISDTLTIGESTNVLIPVYYVNVSDVLTVGESVSLLIPVLFVSISDSMIVSESVAVIVISPGDLAISVSDSLTVTDTIVILLPIVYVSVIDALDITETLGLTIPVNVSVSDALTVAESTALLIPQLFIAVAESLTIAEAVSLLVPVLYVSASEALTVVESIALSIVIPGAAITISVLDSLTLADVVALAIVTIVVPASRVFVVLAEDRTFVILHEDRTYSVNP